MGFFDNKSTPALAQALSPLSRRRVQDALEAQSWTYQVDSDGDIFTGFEYGVYLITFQGENGEVLSIRGRWNAALTPEQQPQALTLCNDWNRDRLWPKTYAMEDNDGQVRINTELNVDFEEGLTDEQLSRQIRCAIATSESFFEELNGHFPEQWAATQQEG